MKKVLFLLSLVLTTLFASSQTTTTYIPMLDGVQLKKVKTGVNTVYTIQTKVNGVYLDVSSTTYVDTKVAAPANITNDATHRWATDALIINWNIGYNKRLVSHAYNTSTGLFTSTLGDASTVTVTLPQVNLGNLGTSGEGVRLLVPNSGDIGVRQTLVDVLNNKLSVAYDTSGNVAHFTIGANQANWSIDGFPGQITNSQVPNGFDVDHVEGGEVSSSQWPFLASLSAPVEARLQAHKDTLDLARLTAVTKSNDSFYYWRRGVRTFIGLDATTAPGTGDFPDGNYGDVTKAGSTVTINSGAIVGPELATTSVGISKLSFDADIPITGRSIYNNSLEINTQSGTTYTLQTSDLGKVIYFTSASSITLTVPSGLIGKPSSSSSVGFQCTIVQGGAGKITITGSGATVANIDAKTRTRGQEAYGYIASFANNSYKTTGDLE